MHHTAHRPARTVSERRHVIARYCQPRQICLAASGPLVVSTEGQYHDLGGPQHCRAAGRYRACASSVRCAVIRNQRRHPMLGQLECVHTSHVTEGPGGLSVYPGTRAAILEALAPFSCICSGAVTQRHGADVVGCKREGDTHAADHWRARKQRMHVATLRPCQAWGGRPVGALCSAEAAL